MVLECLTPLQPAALLCCCYRCVQIAAMLVLPMLLATANRGKYNSIPCSTRIFESKNVHLQTKPRVETTTTMQHACQCLGAGMATTCCCCELQAVLGWWRRWQELAEPRRWQVRHSHTLLKKPDLSGSAALGYHAMSTLLTSCGQCFFL